MVSGNLSWRSVRSVGLTRPASWWALFRGMWGRLCLWWECYDRSQSIVLRTGWCEIWVWYVCEAGARSGLAEAARRDQYPGSVLYNNVSVTACSQHVTPCPGWSLWRSPWWCRGWCGEWCEAWPAGPAREDGGWWAGWLTVAVGLY